MADKQQALTYLDHIITYHVKVTYLQSGPKVLDHSDIFISDFPLLPIFNAAPHHTGPNFTIERIIGMGGGKGEFYFETRVWDGLG